MRKGILGALLAFGLMAGASAEVVRQGATTFNPDGPKTNQMQDIPAAHKLGGDNQTEKMAVTLKSSLPAYLEKSNLDGPGHSAADFQATRGTTLTSKITPQAAFGGSGKQVASPNRLNPIDL